MVICGLKEQFELFQSLKSFEVDMSYKRLKKVGLNEVLFAAHLQPEGKSK
jgi:hypothetical protein